MSIRDDIIKVASEYLAAKAQPLRDHPLAAFLRDTFPRDVSEAVNQPSDPQQLVVQGTKLPGNWATNPWVGIMDPRLTDGIQQGLYVVLVFAENMQSAFLSLALGVANTPKATVEKWLPELRSKYLPPPEFAVGPLPTGSLASRGLGVEYEQASVFFKKLDPSQLPSEATLVEDFRAASKLLREIGDSGGFRYADVAREPDTQSFTIQGQRFRFSADDVEAAFDRTTDEHWKERPGIEPYWHLVIGDHSKPVKAVFRNMRGVSEGFEFSTNDARAVFGQLGFDVVNKKMSVGEKPIVLLGTSASIGEYVGHAQDVIRENGAWASSWSFLLKPEFLERAKAPLALYINSGGGRFPYRVIIEDWQTRPGGDGMKSPWPDITDEDTRELARDGPKASQIFKTWFKVVGIESLDPPLALDDFEPALGTTRQALLNQSAFGYATLRPRDVAETATATGAGGASVCRNLILYGPPGTGKTHWLRQKLQEYTDAPSTVDQETWIQELIAGYGWRPVIAASLANLARPARVPEIRDHPWVQAKAKQRGRRGASVQATLWGFLQEHTPETVSTVKVSVRRPPFIFSKQEGGEWTLLPDWEELDEESAMLSRNLQAGPRNATEPIRRYRVVTFHPSFSYEDFVRGIRPVITAEDGTTQFRLVDGIFKQICDEARANVGRRYALFIDEINRANIAKVFGELITLIEPDKRATFDAEGRLTHGMAVQLPGGEGADVADPPFGVPTNLDIYGTMNTADRSIALLDVALRRRFEFQEMEPDYTVIDRLVGGVNLGELLRRINDRLEYLLDRDHRIGHAYLISVYSIADLSRAFRLQIIPLLQEYFFDDLGRVQLTLSTGQAASPFVAVERFSPSELFGRAHLERTLVERPKYRITAESTWTEDSFTGIYQSAESGEAVDTPA